MKAIGNALFAIVIVFGILTSDVFPCYAEPRILHQNILVLNSYNRGFSWTDDQTEGIVDTIRGQQREASIFIEYLDWKNNPKRGNLQALVNSYRIKYGERHIDLIITTDDAALEFALEHRAAIFSGAPIVFSGVQQQAAARLIQGQSNVTGVYEEIDAENLVKTMLDFNPKLEQIYLIYDNTESGLVTREPIEQAVKRLKSDIRIIDQNILGYRSIIEQLRQASPDHCAALVTSYSRDINGVSLELERFVRLFSEASKIPVYAIFDFQVGNGAVGGSVLSGKLSGKSAAALGLRVLQGERVSEVMAQRTDTGLYVFDYEQILRYRLPVSKIPEGSRVLHRPASFYDQHKKPIWTIITLFVLMVISIAFLIENVNRRKTAETNLKKNNEELTALNEEMLASQEELHAQYGQLVTTQEALVQSKQRYKLSLEGANDGLWDWDIVKDEVYFSDRCVELLGLSVNTIHNLKAWLADVVPAEEAGSVLQAMNDHLQGLTPHYVCEHRICKPDCQSWILARGKVLLNAHGQPVRMAGSLTDITGRKLQEEAVNYMAFHDALTGLPNRAALNGRLAELLAPGKREDSTGAIILFDLDNFKIVNDTFGHSYGDKLLIAISRLLQEFISQDKFIARMGGDEFVILLEGITERGAIAAWLDGLLAIFNQPIVLDDKSVHVTMSIGVTTFPGDGRNREQLVKNADMALYKAKEQGKNRYAFFEKYMDEAVQKKAALEHDLRDALKGSEFQLWYQPQIDAQSGKIIGFEALIRWLSGKNGLVMPLTFIQLAEETGLIVPIGYWVIREACHCLRALHGEGYNRLTVTVNISVVQLMQSDFAANVQNILVDSGVPAQNLGIEITESVLMESMETHIRKLRTLHKTGLKIYLDDFGTGYSSLKYLKYLPIDVVKIDKSFIDGVTNDETRDLTESIIALIHRLGLKAVAEGVEQDSQLAKLKEYGCDAVQGYLFSRPVPESQIRELLRKYGG